jgi:hypothetical protein
MSDNLLVKEITTNKNKKQKYIPFWGEDPNVLFTPKYLMEFFPTENMTYEQKLNSITRTVIILTIISIVIYGGIRHFIIGLITMASIFILHHYHQKEQNKVESKKVVEEVKESFENPAIDYLTQEGEEIPNDLFSEPEPSNPFGNVMMTDYDYNPNKKPAPAAFNQNVNDKILNNAKKMVSEANPDQPDIADKLFKDLGDQYVFEQSLRPFHSNPSTTIPNDQQAFSEFCYGSMISCKEGNNFACARNLSRHTNY